MPFGRITRKQARKFGFQVTKPKTKVDRLARKVQLVTRGMEHKRHDKVPTAHEFANDKPILGLSLISEGPASNQRIGLKIAPVSVEIRGKVIWSSDVLYRQQPVRLIVFRDRDQLGTLPLITDVLEGNNISSLYNNINLKRFTILSDSIIEPHNSTTTQKSSYFKVKKKLSGVIRYLDNTLTQAGQGKGNLYCMFLADQNLATVNTTISFNARLTYLDY